MKFFMLMQHLSVALFIAMMGSEAQAKSLAHDSSYQVHDPVSAEIMQLIYHEDTAADEITSLLQLLHEHHPEVYEIVTSNLDMNLVAQNYEGSDPNCYECRERRTDTGEYVGGAGVGVVSGETKKTTQESEFICINKCRGVYRIPIEDPAPVPDDDNTTP